MLREGSSPVFTPTCGAFTMHFWVACESKAVPWSVIWLLGFCLVGGLSWCSPWHEELFEYVVGVFCSCPWAFREGSTGNALRSLQMRIPWLSRLATFISFLLLQNFPRHAVGRKNFLTFL